MYKLNEKTPVGNLNLPEVKNKYDFEDVVSVIQMVPGKGRNSGIWGSGVKDQIYVGEYFIGNPKSISSTRSVLGPQWILTKKTPTIGIYSKSADLYLAKLWLGDFSQRGAFKIGDYASLKIQIGDKSFVLSSHHSVEPLSLVGLTESTPVSMTWESSEQGTGTRYVFPGGSFNGTLLDYLQKVHPGEFKWIEKLEGTAFIQTK